MTHLATRLTVGLLGLSALLPPQVTATDNENRGVYFFKKAYMDQPLPEYATSKDYLPSPVLDDHPELVEMYWKCWELAFHNIKKPAPGSPLVSAWLDAAFSDNIFQWDTIFMMMFARYGHYQFPAIQSLDNFYALQRPSGYICREFHAPTGKEIHFGFEGGLEDPTGWQNTVNPPLFAWAECETFKITGDKSRFAAVLPVLEKYVEWLNRDGDPADIDVDSSGRRSKGTPHELYWNTGLGSGMDNTPKPTGKGCGWVDMSCQMVMQYNDLAVIYRELGKPAKAQVAETEAKAIAERINQWCWDETDGFYYDVDAKGEKFKKKTSGGFWPLIAGVASKTQAARLVEHLKNPKEFWRPVVFPTLAANENEYQANGGYWVGGVWAPTDYAIIKGLDRYGYDGFASEASERYLAAMAEVFRKTGTVWENYAPESMNPGTPAKPDFVGWSGCGPIALLIEDVLGFRPDAIDRRVVWQLHRTDRHGIERLRIGDAILSLVCEKRESADSPASLSLQSDREFEIEIIHPKGARKVTLHPGDPVRLTIPE